MVQKECDAEIFVCCSLRQEGNGFSFDSMHSFVLFPSSFPAFCDYEQAGQGNAVGLVCLSHT